MTCFASIESISADRTTESYQTVEVEEAASPSLAQKAKLGLVPRFRNSFGALNPKGVSTYKRGQGPRARRPQQVWRATEPSPALASVEFISAERTTESYSPRHFLTSSQNRIHPKHNSIYSCQAKNNISWKTKIQENPANPKLNIMLPTVVR